MGLRTLVALATSISSLLPAHSLLAAQLLPPASSPTPARQFVDDIDSLDDLLPAQVLKESKGRTAEQRAEAIGVGQADDTIFFMVNPGLRVGHHVARQLNRGEASRKVEALLFGTSPCQPAPLAEFLVHGTQGADGVNSENSFAELLGEMARRAFGKLLPVEATEISDGAALIEKNRARGKPGRKFFLFTLDATCSTPGIGALVVQLELKLYRFEMSPIEVRTGDPDPDKQRITSAQLMFSDTATGSAPLPAEIAASPENPNRFAPTVKAAIIDAFRERLALSVWNDLLQRKWTTTALADAPRGAHQDVSSVGAGR